MTRLLPLILCAAALVLRPAVVLGQQPSPAPETVGSDRREFTNEQKNAHYIGHVTIERSDGNIYADDVRVFGDENRMVATGNVVFAQGNNRVSAERAEFDIKTGLGTFYNAWGIAAVQPPPSQARGGVVAPQRTGQDTHVYFFGDKIEKLGPKKYKITKGGFSTCVQPTPRWDLTAGTVILNVDHYTLLKQAVFNVKGVPMLYLPIFYYPTTREDRATGFLIPTYGVSTIRGHTLSNAFFWAINRSQDATFTHDWFSRTGQGYGSEYRYNLGLGSDGTIRALMLNEHETTYTLSDGSPNVVPARRSYEIRGGANQVLPGNWRARANANYFSSLEASQTYNTNINDISRSVRSFGGNLIGGFNSFTLSATLDHNEYFYTKDISNLSGNWPRVSFARTERPLGNSDVYVGFDAEYLSLLATSKVTSGGVTTETDSGRGRVDVAPKIRYPFKRWPFLTVNTSLTWRDTYYTRSYPLNPDGTIGPALADNGINRRLYSVQSQIVGPVFNRIWDTPNNGYAEKFKHTVEPYFSISKTSTTDTIRRILVFDGIDSYTDGTNLTYGINNRFFAKRKLTPGGLSQAGEFLSVELSQTYYTNPLSAQYDRNYQTSLTTTSPSTYSPLALSVRALPSAGVNATVRAEFDATYHELRMISALGTYSWAGRVQASGGWSKKAFVEKLAGFNDPAYLDHFINGATTVHTKDNRVGGAFAFNYDVLHKSLLNQRITAFYNAQCCGLAFEYQSLHYLSYYAVPADRRFFMTFTLAGLGNFSPFSGALGGIPR
jgi:LPS-assembly protein